METQPKRDGVSLADHATAQLGGTVSRSARVAEERSHKLSVNVSFAAGERLSGRADTEALSSADVRFLNGFATHHLDLPRQRRAPGQSPAQPQSPPLPSERPMARLK